MREYGVYRVLGERPYQGHQPGSTFESRLLRFAERRAIARNEIELIERIVPALVPDTYALPEGWLHD